MSKTRWNTPTSQYLAERDTDHLPVLLRVAIEDMQQGLSNAEYFGYGDTPEKNFRFVSGADRMDRIYDEIQMRQEFSA